MSLEKIQDYLENSRERLATDAQQLELTESQVSQLRSEFDRLMIEYDLGPSELNLILGAIAGVTFWEWRLHNPIKH